MKKSERLKIAEKIRQFRAKHRLTQREFGAMIEVSQVAISYFERGQHGALSDERLERVKTLFGARNVGMFIEAMRQWERDEGRGTRGEQRAMSNELKTNGGKNANCRGF